MKRRALVPALGIFQIFAWGSSYYLMAVLSAPVAADTGWPLSWVVGSLSIGLLVAGLVSPRVGDAIGRRGGRPVLTLASLLLAVGLCVAGLSPALWMFIAGWTVIGVGMGAGLYDAAFATLGDLYGASARSAITTLTLWAGFSSTVCWPLSAFLVSRLGWRGACFGYAAIHLIVSLSLVRCVLPADRPSRSAAGPAVAPEAVLRADERLAYFVTMATFVLLGLFMSIVSVHLLTLLQRRGLSLAEAVSLGALIGPAQVAARVGEMVSKGRHHPFWTLVAAAVLTTAGLGLLAIDFPITGLSLVLYGAGNGIYSIAKGALPLALFGAERYPSLMGRLARPHLVAQALGPALGTLLLSALGAGLTLSALAGLAAVNLALAAVLWRPVQHMRQVEPR
jgi:predicted MFS family arabinose efflux permease